MTVLLPLALAATLLAGDIAEDERVRRLAPYFEPRPGQMVTVDLRELRDFGKHVAPPRLRGKVRMAPPKGHCFTVQRARDVEDTYVCKPTDIAFTIDDLGKDGRLTWQIRTGDGDFGTPLAWPSPYRAGIVTPFDQSVDKDPPVYKFIAECKVDRETALGRRIKVRLFTGETWSITFPEKDQLLPQPDPVANLPMVASGGKVSVSEAAKSEPKKEDQAAEAPKEEKPATAEPAADPAAAAPPEKDVRISESDDRKDWAIPIRGAYGMSARHFMPQGSVPPGLKGTCRYSFVGPTEDPDTGRLECHDVDGYKVVFLPLTCLKDVRVH